MAGIFACSFGDQYTGGAGFGGIAHWQAPTGTGMSFTNAVPAPNTASGYRLLIDSSGAAQQTFIVRTFAAGLKTSYHRFYYRLETTLGTGSTIYGTTGAAGHIVVLNNRTIQARATAGGTLVGSQVLTLDTDYLIEMAFDSSGTTWTVDWWVDGVAQPQASAGSQVATDQATVRLGLASASTTCKMRYAHLLIGNSLTDDFGPGTVEMAGVAQVGTHSFTAGDFQDHTSTNLTVGETASDDYVKELPPTTTEHVKQVVSRSAGYLEYIYDTTAAGRIPVGVEQVIAGHNVGTQSNLQKLQLNDGAAQSDAYAAASLGTSAGTLVTGSKHWTAAPSGAWTAALADTLRARWGFSTDVATVPALDATWLEIAYPPAAVGGDNNDPMGMSGFFGA
jgi:hypothetical protein